MRNEEVEQQRDLSFLRPSFWGSNIVFNSQLRP